MIKTTYEKFFLKNFGDDEEKTFTFEEVKKAFDVFVKKTNSDTRRKLKKKKNPNAPKKATGAFFMFCSPERKKLQTQKEHEGKKSTEISKVLGEMWKKLSDEEKKPYQEKAEADKKRYKKEKEAYDKKEKSSSDSSSEEDEKKSPKKRKTSNYQRFSQSLKGSNKLEGLKFGEISAKISSLWKDMSDKQKAKYGEDKTGSDESENEEEKPKKAKKFRKPRKVEKEPQPEEDKKEEETSPEEDKKEEETQPEEDKEVQHPMETRKKLKTPVRKRGKAAETAKITTKKDEDTQDLNFE